ncbi:vesicle-associated membrane protein 5 [Bombina bombina]|uniref:vesicle-associated membrane protein 5-like n=1 Tax=Bombina bombina TaxID=8345 RepID=UPI00235AA11D|nr:vesicle-associated membrane protein 5-like [Bombina bombina]XP_053573781.1 vesicle-associated membrane protein 5 [Bombina bombina]
MASNNLEMCQQSAEEVKGLMADNVKKVIEREGKIADMEVRSDDLLSMATSFQKTARTVERHTRWEKWRWYIIAGSIVTAVIVILITILAVQLGGGSSSPAEERAASEDPN